MPPYYSPIKIKREKQVIKFTETTPLDNPCITFSNFKTRTNPQNGYIETMSETDYKGYTIRLRSYTNSGISCKIIKLSTTGKQLRLREENYYFYDPTKLLQKAKNYIDQFSSKLELKFNKLNKNGTNQ
jgi:hypothetical protein